jgi:hypothetical protein
MKSGFVARVVLAVGLMAGAVSMTADADACGDEVAPAIDYRIMGVARAEQTMRDGNHLAAAGSVLRMIPHARASKPGNHAVFARALRILAVATARSGGVLPLEKEVPDYVLGAWAGKQDADKTSNLEWAVNTLRVMNEQKKNDPGIQTDLGEALAAMPGHETEALALLGGLAEKDLMTSAEGYAALARLRDKSGDAAGRDAASKRCETMSKNASVCGIASVAKSSGAQG